MFYGSGAPNPNTQCQTCQPGLTTTTWSSVTNGMSCMTSEVCYSGNCQSGCYIGGTFYSSGQMNPSNMCQTCEPFNSTTIWTTLAGCGSH